MDEILKLFGVMLAIMVPVAIGGGVFVVIGHLTKRVKARRGDFVERMLPALREGKP